MIHESLHGYKVIVFCDDGVTGTHFDRPKFDELIEMARNQEIHCIMVKDLSRFGRNFLEMKLPRTDPASLWGPLYIYQ